MKNFIYSNESKAKEIAFNSLFELLPINFSWFNTEGYILGCNEQTLISLEIPSYLEIIGKHITKIASLEAWENTKHVIAESKSIICEETHEDKLGNTKYFLSIKSPIKTCSGEIVGATNVAVDITDRKLMEFELKNKKIEAQEANIAKSEFIKNMQHDLRTPFSGILSVAEFLESNEIDSFKREYLKDIKESSSSILDFLNDIILKIENCDNSKYSESTFCIRSTLMQVKLMFIPELKSKKLELNLNMSDSNIPYAIVGDELKIKSILLNVISNSVKFTEKGKINASIECHNISNEKIEIKFTIEDTGIGIAENNFYRIFDNFTRLNPSYEGVYKGIGSGLHIVKQYLEEIGGRCHVESELGNWTKFTIIVPFKLCL